MFRFFFLVLALVSSAYGAGLPPVPRLDGRIVGGAEAAITEAPYQVSVMLDYSGTGVFLHYCGGSIISRTVIVTAAHCTDGTPEWRWKIRAGAFYHYTGGTVIGVESIVQHSGFNSRLDNDISLLKLISPLIPATNIAAITLPAQDAVVYDGADAFVTGWGTIEEGGSVPLELQKITVPIVNQEECVNAYSTYNPVTTNMICAGRLGAGGQDACLGDDGGPLTVNKVLVGITSWGNGCAQPQYPGVYTRVSSYKNWIANNI